MTSTRNAHVRRGITGLVLVAATTVGLAMAQTAPANAATAASRTARVCQTQTSALLNAAVYQVCLTATDSYDGTRSSGYVAGVYCNVHLPTGAGWACSVQRHGSYWNSTRRAWEDWLNYKLVYVSPLVTSRVAYANCIYLRVDTQAGGGTTYQSFAMKNLGLDATC